MRERDAVDGRVLRGIRNGLLLAVPFWVLIVLLVLWTLGAFA